MKKIFIGTLSVGVVAAVTATAIVTSVSAKSDQQINTGGKEIQEQKVDGYRFILKDGVIYTIYETDRASMQRIFDGDEDEFNKLYKAVFKFLSKNNALSGLNYLSFISTTANDMKFGTATSKKPSQLVFLNLKSKISNWHEIGNWFKSRKPEIYNSDFEFYENTGFTKGVSKIQWWAEKSLGNIIPNTGLPISDEAVFMINQKPVGSKIDWKRYIPQFSNINLSDGITFDVFVSGGSKFTANGIESSLKLVFKSATDTYTKVIHPIQAYGAGNWLMNGAMSKLIQYGDVFPNHMGDSSFEYKIDINTQKPSGLKAGDEIKYADLFKGQQELIGHLGGKTFREWMADNLGGSSNVADTKIIIKEINDKSIKVEFTLKLQDKADATKITSASMIFELDYTK